MASESSILSWMLALPAVGGLAVFILPAAHARKARGIAMAVLGALLVLASISASWIDWLNHAGTPQLITFIPWLPRIGSAYHVGADGLSMGLILLTAAMGMCACWASYGIQRMPRAYFALLLWLIAGLIGVFASLDLLQFFIFFEWTLIPIYFLVGGWGGARKEYAASKFLLFSLVSAVALLLAVIAIGRSAGTMDLTQFSNVHFEAAGGMLIVFWTLIVVFGIRMAAAPLHTWLGDVLVEAPTPIAMVIAAVVTKTGAYGLLRIAYPLFTPGPHDNVLAWAGIAIIFYASLAALAQRDLRRIIAFGTVAQMGYVLLGLAVMTPAAILGVLFALIAHAVWSAKLLFITGIIHDRAGHCDIKRLGGLAGHMPAFAGWSSIGFLAAMGLPGLCGFVGELLIILGIFSASDPANRSGVVPGDALMLAVLAAAAMVLTGACFLWTYQRVFLGAPKPEHSNIARLSRSEKWILALLAVATITLGIAPNLILDPLRTWIESGSLLK